jgi:tRNA(Ile)-lysidine synthase
VAARRRPSRFTPSWLGGQLRQLLPDYPQRALCVAFSGGVDSTALLAALARLRPAPQRLRALHIDHGLLPQSGSWSAHCRRVARALGLPLAVRRVSVPRVRGESLEEAARIQRYRVFAATLAKGEALLSAHHEDDQLETVLLQLLRGAGVAGIAAMPALAPCGRGLLLRPLLAMPHRELTAWASAQGLAWVEDPSNADLRLDRNYLRAQVLPALRQRWPSAAAAVARAARHAAEAQRLLDELGAADCARASCGAHLSAAALRALSPDRRRNALRYWIAHAGHRAPPTRRLEEIASVLLQARADSHPEVAWSGVRVQREADLLVLGVPAGAPLPPAACRWDWQRRRSCVLPGGCGTLTLRRVTHGPIDLDALAPTLSVRARRGGERLRTARGGARRALKSLLQEARVPLARRASLPLVFAGEQLIAAADLWLDASVQAGAATRRRGRLKWSAPAK